MYTADRVLFLSAYGLNIRARPYIDLLCAVGNKFHCDRFVVCFSYFNLKVPGVLASMP